MNGANIIPLSRYVSSVSLGVRSESLRLKAWIRVGRLCQQNSVGVAVLWAGRCMAGDGLIGEERRGGEGTREGRAYVPVSGLTWA